MASIVRFQARGNTYTFPTNPGDQDFKTNFGELVARASRMPGASGGYDEYGVGRAPSAVGMVQHSFFLTSDTRSGMQALRDAVYKMADWGVGLLVQSMSDGTERFCYARVNNINMPEKRHMHSELHQQVQISWQVSDPYWYKPGTELIYDYSATPAWDNVSLLWDGGGANATITNSGSVSITYNGSATTVARIVLSKLTSGTAWNPVVRRVVNGAVVDELRWTYGIGQYQYVEMNPTTKRVRWVLHTTSNYVYDGYALGYFSAKHPDWMRLEPGSNSIQVLVDGDVQIFVRYMERYL